VLHKHWDIFADTFRGTPFLAGEVPGALDIMAAIVSKWSGTRMHLANHRPEFLALLKKIEAHPLVQPVLAKHFDS